MPAKDCLCPKGCLDGILLPPQNWSSHLSGSPKDTAVQKTPRILLGSLSAASWQNGFSCRLLCLIGAVSWQNGFFVLDFGLQTAGCLSFSVAPDWSTTSLWEENAQRHPRENPLTWQIFHHAGITRDPKSRAGQAKCTPWHLYSSKPPE